LEIQVYPVLTGAHFGVYFPIAPSRTWDWIRGNYLVRPEHFEEVEGHLKPANRQV
jgi:hypothetical protein